MPIIRPGPHEVRAGFSSAAHARTFPLFGPLLPAEHGRGGNRGPFPSTRAAPLSTPKPKPVVPAGTNNPYAGLGLFAGSAWDQANKIADYLLGPYKDQYNQQLAARHALDATRLKQLQDYIAGIAAQFQGVAPQVLAAYRAASGDQSQIAQGFSGDIRDAVQASANQDNALLAEIGAPSGQMIPGQQATDVGDVTYGLGGWIPATLMSQLGARAFADAAKIPATISARGLSAVSDLVGSQQEADAAAQAAYDQVLAQRPGNVLDLYGQIKERGQAATAAKQQAKADALKAKQDVYDAKVKHAEDLTKASNYLYVVTKGGTVKRATGRNGKPIYTGDLELVTDKATGITRALNPQTGELVWARQTQTPQPGAAAEPPKTITGPDGLYAWQPGKKPGVWNLVPIGPRKQVAEKPPSTFQGPDGLYYWKPRKGGGFDPVPIGPRKPPDMPDVNYRTVGNNVVAFWFDPKTNKPQQQVVYQGTPDQKLQVVQTGGGGYDIVDLSVPGGEVVKSFPAVTQTIGGDSDTGEPKTYRLADGRLGVMTIGPDGTPKLVPIDPTRRPTRPRGSSGNDVSPYRDTYTGQPLSWDDVDEAIGTIQAAITGNKQQYKPGTRPLGKVIDAIEQYGIPRDLWAPYVLRAYGLPRSTKDLKYMSTGKLFRVAVFLGYRPDPNRKQGLNKQQLIDWITAHSPKAEAAATAAGGNFGGQLVEFAKRQLGQTYVWGGETRKEGGFDCSGLVDWALRQTGYTGPRVTTWTLAKMGTEVKPKDLQPGDLIITNGGKHVVIYAGDGKVVAGSSAAGKVVMQPLSQHKDSIVTIRRMGPNPAQEAADLAPDTGTGGQNPYAYPGQPKIKVWGTAPQKVSIVLHDWESTGDPNGIVAGWKNDSRGYGAQFVVGLDGTIVQTTDPLAITKHAGSGKNNAQDIANNSINGQAIGIEMAGHASWSKAEWLAHPQMLEAVAKLIAGLSKQYGIPIQWIGANIFGHGVTSHAEVSAKEPLSQGHTDPGPNFPFQSVLARAHQIAASGTPTPGSTTAPALPGGNVPANMYRSYMRARGSPLAGLGQVFVNAGTKYGVDPRLLVAIAGAESNFGTSKRARLTRDPFGWLSHKGRFGSWAEAIDAMAKHIREDYFDRWGLTTVATMAPTYAPLRAANDPQGLNQNWVGNVTRILVALGGNPDALRLGG